MTNSEMLAKSEKASTLQYVRTAPTDLSEGRSGDARKWPRSGNPLSTNLRYNREPQTVCVPHHKKATHTSFTIYKSQSVPRRLPIYLQDRTIALELSLSLPKISLNNWCYSIWFQKKNLVFINSDSRRSSPWKAFYITNLPFSIVNYSLPSDRHRAVCMAAAHQSCNTGPVLPNRIVKSNLELRLKPELHRRGGSCAPHRIPNQMIRRCIRCCHCLPGPHWHRNTSFHNLFDFEFALFQSFLFSRFDEHQSLLQRWIQSHELYRIMPNHIESYRKRIWKFEYTAMTET